MFSILLRDTAKFLRISSAFKCNLPNAVIGFDYSSFTVGDFMRESSDETGTLLTRFVKYLAIENSKFDPLIPTTIRYPDFFPVSDLMSFQSELKKVDVTQIPHLIVFLFTYKTNGDPQKYVRIINEIDKFCEVNLKEMDYDTILRTLYAFMFLLPNKITKTSFYNKAMGRLAGDFNKECPREKFVKVCFYLGLGKKNSNSVNLLNKFLRQHLSQYLPELTPMDLAIVSNAAYKSSVPIGNTEFFDRVKSETLELSSVEDDAILVNMVKILRHNKIKSREICEKLDALCSLKEIRKFQTAGIAHIFAYFAECQWNNKETCSKFINETMHRIRSSSDDIRGKDISTFLWCCAQLHQGDQLQPNDLKCIEKLILEKSEQDEFRFFIDQLIDCALSLWMLGYPSRGLIAEVTSLRVNPNSKNPDRVKLDTRHSVLLSCVAIEKPEWLMRDRKPVFTESLPAPDYLVKKRVGLRKAFDKLKAEDVDAEIVTPIEGINVAGILAELSNEQKCYLEVLEEEHVLKFDEVPSAIVQLKIRLLKHLGYNVVTVRANELEELKSIKDLISSSEQIEVKQTVAVKNV